MAGTGPWEHSQRALPASACGGGFRDHEVHLRRRDARFPPPAVDVTGVGGGAPASARSRGPPPIIKKTGGAGRGGAARGRREKVQLQRSYVYVRSQTYWLFARSVLRTTSEVNDSDTWRPPR